ncbi:type II toxin-antitoxin system YoeB family toxin [Aliiglaciecola litoralis]
MELTFSTTAWENYLYWQSTDKKILERASSHIKEISRSPYEGFGKLDPL